MESLRFSRHMLWEAPLNKNDKEDMLLAYPLFYGVGHIFYNIRIFVLLFLFIRSMIR